MKTTLVTITLFLAVSVPAFAAEAKKDAKSVAKAKNEQICTKEYKSEPVERTVCRTVGASAPGTRDCLIRERQASGTRGQNDTVKAEVERHAKCFVQAIRK